VYNIDIMRDRYHHQKRESPLALRILRKNLPAAAFLVLALAGMLSVYWRFNPDGDPDDLLLLSVGAEAAVFEAGALTNTIDKPVPALPVLQRVAQSRAPIRIGLIAGHRGFDSGTACDDGLTEAQVNAAIAERTAELLRERGYASETLDEFDARLDGYSATALVSIHADSCDYINELATGFKIAGSHATDSSALSICIESEYQRATDLDYHPNSITPHMTDYHAFRKIMPGTPAIIIEVGFLNLDRELLTEGTETIAEGLARGVVCYLDQLP
jgi:N-acetylmuramoyl-L-alanine amidase